MNNIKSKNQLRSSNFLTVLSLTIFILVFFNVSTVVIAAPISSRVPIARDNEDSSKIQIIEPSKIAEPVPKSVPTIPPSKTITNQIQNELISKFESFQGFVGFELRDLGTNEVLFNYNSDKLFIPASNTKLITALVALESLGDNYKFETKIYHTGEISPNFRGNLYIKGFGDPVLTSLQYKEILKRATVDRGIETIYGDIIFDYSFMTEEGFGRGWMWDDPQPQIAAINIWQTSYESFKYKTNHEIKDYINFLTTLYLQEIGVEFWGEIRYEEAPSDANLLYTNYSPPLTDIIQQMLETSDNQIAEQIFRNLGAIYGNGKIEDSENHFQKVIKETLGYDPTDYVIKDGCGLSMYNLISPKMLADSLFYLYSKYQSKFFNYLASPYEDSTLEKRFNFEIYAKTGTLYYDSAISGIFKSKSGKYYIFSLMENNFSFDVQKVKEFENSIINYLYENL
ncbi:hypothetical protein HWHPT5561_04070 [Petrotoga sp. HWH.PT.55.6.1]|uniref:D-alanyl-D-alanine carboxypeptidase/D-alanyl-D-alanine-endopeptidase n=1 Tax=unclassified Petrotoga TaxID=2620614 RepID=UPI000CA06378|nr:MULTISPECIES: D-alanyl-D-alanine carboxypeptidase [unclassified Petrotoga]PNR93868.1 hypothetical protein X926_02480 [Petrotoga sp. HWHPT.55.6.3]RPD36092.1 hypothetical protein HWHPT5561_04070 [Petrotoga sp. HWH.PT.55.6.1]